MARRSSSGVRDGASRTASPISWTSAIWSTNHGSNPLAAGDLLDGGAGGQRLLGQVEPAVDRRPQRLEQLVGRAVRPRAPVQKPATFVSVERIALPSASVKLRPSDMTSPTLFIVVVSRGSAPGNFSNANRGIFTTT